MKKAPISDVLSLLTLAPSAFVDTGEYPQILPKNPVKSLAELRKEVAEWAARQTPPLPRRDIDAVVDWLNRNFYKLDK